MNVGNVCVGIMMIAFAVFVIAAVACNCGQDED